MNETRVLSPLPPTIGDRHIRMPLRRPGTRPVQIWLTADRDFAVDADDVIEQLSIADTYAALTSYPLTWVHEWSAPRSLDLPQVSYLWSREVVGQVVQLAADPGAGGAFVQWLTEQHRDLCLRDWDGTLDACLLPAIASPDGREIALLDAAKQIMELLGGHVTREQVRDRLLQLGWIKQRPGLDAGWRPTHLAIASKLVFSRKKAIPGGIYEQCILTGRGFDELLEHVRPALDEPLFEGLGS